MPITPQELNGLCKDMPLPKGLNYSEDGWFIRDYTDSKKKANITVTNALLLIIGYWKHQTDINDESCEEDSLYSLVADGKSAYKISLLEKG